MMRYKQKMQNYYEDEYVDHKMIKKTQNDICVSCTDGVGAPFIIPLWLTH